MGGFGLTIKTPNEVVESDVHPSSRVQRPKESIPRCIKAVLAACDGATLYKNTLCWFSLSICRLSVHPPETCQNEPLLLILYSHLTDYVAPLVNSVHTTVEAFQL